MYRRRRVRGFTTPQGGLVMEKMIRKQVYLAPEQQKLLKRLARKANVTEAEVVRRPSRTTPGKKRSSTKTRA